MARVKKATKKEIEQIRKELLKHYRDAKTELSYTNLFELLIAVMLSAQCTDKRVNEITPALFSRFPTPKALANAALEEIKEYIRSCSFYNNKAKNIKKMAQIVLKEHRGEVPLDVDALTQLPGVGLKTAHVVLIEYSGANLMAVDTHVFRVAHRLGLSSAQTALKTQEDLTKIFKEDLAALHQAMVLFGRYICKAKNPLCSRCFLESFCKTKESFKAR